MTDPASTLCLACGLCCDGNLFTQVPLRDEEVAVVRARGLPVIEREGGAALRQRCGALVGLRCDIYADRPRTCRSYRCMLLMALAEGEVTVEEARAIVERAHALLAAVDAVRPGDMAAMQRARQALRDDTSPPEARAASEAARAWLGRHFQRDTSH